MQFGGKEEFNEFGVRNSVNNESKPNRSKFQDNGSRFALIISVAILFSVFNFIVGYMVGKFLGSPSKTHEVSLENQNTKNLDDILGIMVNEKKVKINDNTTLENAKDINNEDTLLTDFSDLSQAGNSETEKHNENILITSEKNKVTNRYVQDFNKNSNRKFDYLKISQKQKNNFQNSNNDKVSKNKSKRKIKSESYFIQVSSNKKKKYAENLVKKLASMGYKAFITESNLNNHNFYRVKIPFSSYKEAQNALVNIRKISTDAYLIVSRN